MVNEIKVLNFTSESDPDLLTVANELAKLQQRKAHDAIRLLILKKGKSVIAKLKKTSNGKPDMSHSNKPPNPSAARPRCPDSFNAEFGRKLVIYLGGDPSKLQINWCWGEFGRAYAEIRDKIERYLSAARTGNPAWAAYWMCRECSSNREWAEKTIGRAKTGDPAWAAYGMCRDCNSSRQWSEKVIERASTGDPAWSAYGMCRDCASSREWAEKIIELADIGDPAWAAYGMCRDCGSGRGWAQKVIGRAKTGDPAWAAFVLSTLKDTQ